jgi:hypothetical protein
VTNFLHSFNISSPSFWLGFLAGILFAFVISRLIIFLPKAIRSLRKNVSGIRQNISTTGEERLRNDVFRVAQKQHLANALFSLDEIVIIPRVLTPLIQASKSIELAPTDSVSLSVPYIPDWPELAAVYNASTLTLTEALQGGANIILAGHPGSGKTVALAWLASSLARNDPGLASLGGFLPLYVHATDIYHYLKHSDEQLDEFETDLNVKSGKDRLREKKPLDTNASLEVLIKAISTYTSTLTISRLPSVIRSAIEKQHAILLIDRCDELPANQAREISGYIKDLLESFPKLRIITALSYDDLAGLPALGFSLLGMASWTDDERENFLNRWSSIWYKWFSKSDKTQAKKINPKYLNSWLKINNTNLTPLEYTLKVWAAYSGDILGTDGPSAVESYIRRMTIGGKNMRKSLEQFALQLVGGMVIADNPHDSVRSLSDRIVNELSSIPEENAEDVELPKPKEIIKSSQLKEVTNIDVLLDNGILQRYPGSIFGFSHPVFCGYLAGNAISYLGVISEIPKQPAWTGRTLSMYYFAHFGDVTPYINDFIQEDDILHTNHLNISRWLQIAPKNRQWRTTILRTLTSVLQKEKDTPSLAAKLISAMAFSGDSGVSVYFRQLLKSDQSNLKSLAALGCGVLGEKKAIEDLVSMMQEDSPASIRAASLALAAIGDKQSLEFLASTLLTGSEIARRCAAEALANNPVEGHPALKDGSNMEDLLVRRSVAFGLIRVNQPWAVKIVENMQLEDKEWVVRNAALQAFEEYRRKISFAPRPIPEVTELEWLTSYASKIGTSVAPGKPADALILKALANGTQEEILSALDYIRQRCSVDAVEEINLVYTKQSGEIKDVAYHVLWLMMISGIKLPTSVKFNIE